MKKLQVLGIRKLVAFTAMHYELIAASEDALQKIAGFENAAGCILPADLKQFYSECESVEIGAVDILSIDKIRAVQAIYGESMRNQFSSTWFAFASLHDSTFIAFDASAHEQTNLVLYINPYADMGEQSVIASATFYQTCFWLR